jgi:ABC-type transporter Mla subunit MlaD
MTGEELNRTIAFILEQQAQVSSNLAQITSNMAQLTDRVNRMGEKIDRNAESVTALLTIAEIQATEIRDLTESTRSLADRQRDTDERLNALINTVERYISERRNGKA